MFLIITPFILSGFIAIFQSLARDNGSRVLEDPQVRPLAPFPRCIGSECISIEYLMIQSDDTIETPEWVTHTLDFIKNKTSIPNSEIVQYDKKVKTYDELKQYYKKL